MFVQEVNGLLVPRNFKRMATVDTDRGILLLDELLRYLVFAAVIEPLVIYMFLLFIFFMYQYLNLIIFLLCIVIMVIIYIP